MKSGLRFRGSVCSAEAFLFNELDVFCVCQQKRKPLITMHNTPTTASGHHSTQRDLLLFLFFITVIYFILVFIVSLFLDELDW